MQLAWTRLRSPSSDGYYEESMTGTTLFINRVCPSSSDNNLHRYYRHDRTSDPPTCQHVCHSASPFCPFLSLPCLPFPLTESEIRQYHPLHQSQRPPHTSPSSPTPAPSPPSLPAPIAPPTTALAHPTFPTRRLRKPPRARADSPRWLRVPIALHGAG